MKGWVILYTKEMGEAELGAVVGGKLAAGITEFLIDSLAASSLQFKLLSSLRQLQQKEFFFTTLKLTQTTALEDYISASVMLQYNYR